MSTLLTANRAFSCGRTTSAVPGNFNFSEIRIGGIPIINWLRQCATIVPEFKKVPRRSAFQKNLPSVLWATIQLNPPF
jgi:hypothetical protein